MRAAIKQVSSLQRANDRWARRAEQTGRAIIVFLGANCVHDRRHDCRDIEVGRIDDRVRIVVPERRVGAVRILIVARDRGGEDRVVVDGLPFRGQLIVTPLRADFRPRGQEEFVRRFGEDFRADVASFEHAAAAAAEVLLQSTRTRRTAGTAETLLAAMLISGVRMSGVNPHR